MSTRNSTVYSFTDIDECATENLVYRHPCSQLCENTEGSYTCQCHSGYRLSADERTCEGMCLETTLNMYNMHLSCTDINECSEASSSCSQVCTNTEGGFVCDCYPGYMLSDDNSTCEHSKLIMHIVVASVHLILVSFQSLAKLSIPVATIRSVLWPMMIFFIVFVLLIRCVLGIAPVILVPMNLEINHVKVNFTT